MTVEWVFLSSLFKPVMIHVVMQFTRWASETVAWYMTALLLFWVVQCARFQLILSSKTKLWELWENFLMLVRLNDRRILFLPYCSFHFLFTHTFKWHLDGILMALTRPLGPSLHTSSNLYFDTVCVCLKWSVQSYKHVTVIWHDWGRDRSDGPERSLNSLTLLFVANCLLWQSHAAILRSHRLELFWLDCAWHCGALHTDTD